jgi:hypothetical protein
MKSEVAFLSVALIVVCMLCAISSFNLARAWDYLANHERRLRRLEDRTVDFASGDARESEVHR